MYLHQGFRGIDPVLPIMLVLQTCRTFHVAESYFPKIGVFGVYHKNSRHRVERGAYVLFFFSCKTLSLWTGSHVY